MLFDLPAEKRAAIVREFGDEGRAWLDRFPELLAGCVERWKLTLEDTMAGGLPVNQIFFGRGEGGRPVALKVGYPHPELITEMIALRRYDGHHAVPLLDASEALGAILMERVLPGTQFRRHRDDISRSRIPLELFNRISLPAETIPGLPTFEDWTAPAFARFRAGARPDAEFAGYIEQAEHCLETIYRQSDARYMIHGDLHHENILLDGERGWLAIDPKGVIAPPILETGRFLHNFIVDEIPGVDNLREARAVQIREVLEIRFDTFAPVLGVSRDELAAAAWTDLILSSCWMLNAGEDASDGYCIARALAPRL